MSAGSRLPAWQRSSIAWVPPIAVAIGWLGALSATPIDRLADLRAVAFLGGPTLLLAGIHDRLAGYLHAPERQRLLPLPIDPARHFAAAARRHLPRLAVAALVGTVALGFAVAAAPKLGRVHLEIVAGWLWLVALAVPCELAAAGVSADYGRRFAPDTQAHRTQALLTGGLTTAEAAVHLYAPALAIGGAVLLAMPAQLTLARWSDGRSLTDAQLVASFAPGIAIVLAPWFARRGYVRGVWEAVAWLHETIKTIAGPARPEPTPRWVAAITSPVTRLLIARTLRITPFARLRFLAVVGIGTYLALRPEPPSLPGAMAFGLASLAWLLPLYGRSKRSELARWLAALPLSAAARRGVDWRFRALAVGPAFALASTIALRWSLS